MLNSHRWQKGQSGNPKGRPKRGESLAEQVRSALRGAPRQRIIRKVVKLAEGGNLEATKLLWAYGYGPPPREPLVALQQNVQLDSRRDLSRLSVEELLKLRELVAKTEGSLVEEPKPTPLLLPAPVITVQPEPVQTETTTTPESESAEETTTIPESTETTVHINVVPIDQPRLVDALWRPNPWRTRDDL
jgi:hypothetical protein